MHPLTYNVYNVFRVAEVLRIFIITTAFSIGKNFTLPISAPSAAEEQQYPNGET